MRDAPKRDNYGYYPTQAICFFLSYIIMKPYFGIIIGGPYKECLLNYLYNNTGKSYRPYPTPPRLSL